MQNVTFSHQNFDAKISFSHQNFDAKISFSHQKELIVNKQHLKNSTIKEAKKCAIKYFVSFSHQK